MALANVTKVKGAITHDNGGTVHYVPNPQFVNPDPPSLWIPDTVQKYDIGTFYTFNGKCWAYSKTAGTVGPNMSVRPKNEQDTQNRAVQAAADAYATSITITTVSPDGPSYNGTFAKDFLKGGHVVVFPAAGAEYTFTRGIIGNDVLAAAGTLTLYLDQAIPCELTTSATAEVLASMWALVVLGTGTHINQQFCAHAGIPSCYSTTGKWIWVQTWGPTWCSPSATTGVGNNNRLAQFQADGSITDQDAADAAVGQNAGYCMANGYGNGQGAPFIYLMVAHP